MKKFFTFLDTHILRFIIAVSLVFIPLYPKLPSIGISHVWVYVRLEDFLILIVSLIWIVQLLRKKVSLPKPEGYALAAYWIVGLITLLYCLIFVASHLANFFPQIAAFEYLRRIEYMILFFAAFSSVKKQKDVIFYLITLGITLTLITLYGFGQKFYTTLWWLFPSFFKTYQFCFPAYLTGNEEFAKGTPFCLNDLSRISSTFGGHYDLAAYLVLVIPIFVALFIMVKRNYLKVLIALLVVFSLELLNFTSSRTSFAAYLFGVTGMLILWKKKLWIVPVLVVSIGVLFILSTTTLQRFAKTVQQVQIVQVQPGSAKEIQNIIEKTQQNQANTQPQSPPPGTVTVGGSAGSDLASESGQVVTAAELKSIEEQENIDISTVSGAFLFRKAYALDISFTTRFQAEWPRDWQAFLSSPVFGTGYSSLTLASDNDYLRALGETGLAGTLSFLFIFIMFGVFMKNVVASVKDPVIKALLYGLTGGIIGLLINAALIDVFEASKVAEPLWILLGIGVGAAKLYHKEPVQYKKEFIKLFSSQTMIVIYVFLLVFSAFVGSINNFFIADDFTWLHWAATATLSDLPKYFFHSQDFFYRPLDKVIVFFLYEIFSFQPQGFHLFTLFLHFVTAAGAFFLAQKLTRSKLLGALTAGLFVLHPAHAENIFWFSTLSDDLSSLFIIYTLLLYTIFRNTKSVIAYLLSVIFSAFAFVSYEISVVIPFLLLALDFFILRPKKERSTYVSYIPFGVLFVLYFVIRFTSHAFSGGGDYSYHVSRILPNIFGNFFGYTGIFLGGLPFLPFYTFLRTGLRKEWFYFTGVMVLFIMYIAWMIYAYRYKIKQLLLMPVTRLILFCFIFAFISLVPFLPLGNIAPRYFYLASFGYILALVVLLKLLFMRFFNKPKIALRALVIVSVLLAFVYITGDMQEQPQWQESGIITKNTLLYFRKNYSTFSPKTDVYFVNTPVMRNNTWVFPVGLSDGMWFIYRENTPQVHEVGSIEEALTSISKSSNKDYYIFSFNDSGQVKRVQ